MTSPGPAATTPFPAANPPAPAGGPPARRRAGLRVRITAATTLVLAVGLAAGGLVVALLFASARQGALDARLLDESSLLTGLLAGGQLPSPLPASTGMSAQVLDAGGAVIGSTPGVSRLLPLLLDAPPPTRVLSTTDSTLGSQRLRVRLSAATYSGGPVTVVVALALADVDQAAHALGRALLLLVPMVVVAGAASTWWAVGAALGPVERLRAAAEGVLDVRSREPPELPVSDAGDDLSRLASTLNAMLRRLHAADLQQRSFVTDAAHELRSPLASALTQLEVSLQEGPEQVDWPALARDVLVDVERLRALVDDLLLLSRLDAGAPRALGPVDLAELAELAELADLAGPVDPADLAPAPGRRAGPVVVWADRAAVTRAVDNLVANARRHAYSQVRVSAYVLAGMGLLAVEDDGKGVAPGDRDRVFERWTRLDEGRSRDAGGAGLGLAIARAAAQGSGGSLTVGESDLGGARFELRLPLAPTSVQPEQT